MDMFYFSVISQLVSTIREDMGSIYTISEAVAELDVLYSLANYSLSTLHVVRPQFSTHYTAITVGRHPILDGIAHDPPVPNNIVILSQFTTTFFDVNIKKIKTFNYVVNLF